MMRSAKKANQHDTIMSHNFGANDTGHIIAPHGNPFPDRPHRFDPFTGAPVQEAQPAINPAQMAAMGAPHAQQINVVTNNAAMNLPFKEWLLRGLVGGVGRAAAWPFALAGRLVEKIFGAVIGFVKIAALIIMVPTLIWLGLMLREELATADSVENGTALIVDHAEDVTTGIGRGLTK